MQTPRLYVKMLICYLRDKVSGVTGLRRSWVVGCVWSKAFTLSNTHPRTQMQDISLQIQHCSQ